MKRLTLLTSLSLLSACIADVDHAPDAEREVAESQQALAVLVAPQPTFSATYVLSSTAQLVSAKRTHAEFSADYDARWGQGYRLVSLTTHVMNNQVYYSGVWRPSTSSQFVGLGRTYAQFQAEYAAQWSAGFRLIALASYVIGQQVYYSGVWNPSTAGQFVAVGRTADGLVAEYNKQSNAGLKLLLLNSNVVNGQVLYDGVWNPITAGQALRLSQTAQQLIADYGALWDAGYRLAHLTTYVSNGVVYYGSVYNPGTAGQFLTLGRTLPEFNTQVTDRANNGWKLSGLYDDHVEMLDIGAMADSVRAGFANRAVGYSVTLATNTTRVPVTAGLRRTLTDSPARAWTAGSRINFASVSKTITAIGVLQLLTAKGVSLDASISPYLPTDWYRGPYVSTITFRELLTHTSGLRDGLGETYADLSRVIIRGVKLADKTPLYSNVNYVLFRIIIPYLNGFSEAGVTDRATATSNAYLSYMNQRVFAPAGVSSVSLTPSSLEPSLSYPFPAGNTRGTTWGDTFTIGAAGGLQMSTNDVTAVMLKVRDGTLLHPWQQAAMDLFNLGWDYNTPARHGYVSVKGGSLGGGGGAGLNSTLHSFSSGLQVAVVFNSPVTFDFYGVLTNAHESSWVPVS